MRRYESFFFFRELIFFNMVRSVSMLITRDDSFEETVPYCACGYSSILDTNEDGRGVESIRQYV